MHRTVAIAIALFVLVAIALFFVARDRRSRVAPDDPEVGLRNLAFNLTPQQAGISPSDLGVGVWGAVTEVAFPEGFVTLVSLLDGSTSLYAVPGQSLIGLGGHQRVSSASKAFLVRLEPSISSFSSIAGAPAPPRAGRVRFCALTRAGVSCSAEIPANALLEPSHPLASAFAAFNEVLTVAQAVPAERPWTRVTPVGRPT